jgi:hypothetical protein
MELNIESVSYDGREIAEHIVEQLMIVILDPFVQFSLMDSELEGKNLEDF